MTTIIIQGDKLEANKTIDVLRKTFPVINKKASYINENGTIHIIDVSTQNDSIDLTDEQVLFSLDCCAKRDRDCVNCHYRSINNCKEQLQTDGAVAVYNLLRKNKTDGEKNEII